MIGMMTGNEGGIVHGFLKIQEIIEKPYHLEIEEVETQYAPAPAVPGYGPNMPNEIKTYTFVVFKGENSILRTLSLQEVNGFVQGLKKSADWEKQQERTMILGPEDGADTGFGGEP